MKVSPPLQQASQVQNVPPAVIRTKGLTKRYGLVAALQNVHIEVPTGAIFGLLGPNGAGKTTVIRLLLGLMRPTSGQIELFGQDIRRHLPTLLSHVGALIEAPAYYSYLSGRENLTVLARTAGRYNAARIEQTLALLGLSAHDHQPVKTYSLGMKQRLGIAGALLNDPDLLILDEPTNGLDPAGIEEIRELGRTLARQGKTIFLSSHLLKEVEEICTHVAIIKAGQVLVQGEVATLLAGRRALHLRIAAPQAVAALLEHLSWVQDVQFLVPDAHSHQASGLLLSGEGWLRVLAPPARCAELTRFLAEQGHFVAELSVVQQSLETFFLELTRHPISSPAVMESHGAR